MFSVFSSSCGGRCVHVQACSCASSMLLCVVFISPWAYIATTIPLLTTLPNSALPASLQESANYCIERCKSVRGLKVASNPQGAMYIMVEVKPVFRDIDGAVQFAGQNQIWASKDWRAGSSFASSVQLYAQLQTHMSFCWPGIALWKWCQVRLCLHSCP